MDTDKVNADRLVRNALIERMREAGIRVDTDSAEAQRILDEKKVRSRIHGTGEYITPELRVINDSFNSMLGVLTAENADNLAFQLGIPNAPMKDGGVQDKPLKLYGNKILAKQRKHGFLLEELRNLPVAVANPIAIFNNYGSETNRSILTELQTRNGNFLVSVEVGDGVDIDFNIVSSVFGKGDVNIVDWLKSGYATYINNDKVQNFLSYHSALIAGASAKPEPLSDAKIQQISELNKLLGEKLYIRTKNFREWFGDWEKVRREDFWDSGDTSKVVDENLNPKVVLHGTPNKDFYEFDINHPGNTTDAGWLGKGFYFYGNNPEYARQYAGPDGRVLEVYLNIRNPYIATAEDFNRLANANDEEESRLFRESLEAEGYDGVFYNGDLNEEWVAFYPNQIKSAIENMGTYRKDSNDICLMLVPTGSIFISNARRAVEEIGQAKATPEQWLRMIEKNGGIKAGEDRWTGLSDWLRNCQERTLTKRQVLEYICENQVRVEEVSYVDPKGKMNSPKLDMMNEEFLELTSVAEEETGSLYTDDYARWAFNQMCARYGSQFRQNTEFVEDGEGLRLQPAGNYYGGEPTEQAAEYYNLGRLADAMRLDYTTVGLDNKREIALVVPDILPWNREDKIHFGDAGDGRAVAWVRFGETLNIVKDGEIADAARKLRDFKEELYDKYPSGAIGVGNGLSYEDSLMLHKLECEVESYRHVEKVLVIDEIQSKRHQEGRRRGYYGSRELAPITSGQLSYFNDISRPGEAEGHYAVEVDGQMKYFTATVKKDMGAREAIVDEINSQIQDWNAGITRDGGLRVPAAPFEKNWHELAMKRMLRYAAENGYDRVAWTTGLQQAGRYDIGDVVCGITAGNWTTAAGLKGYFGTEGISSEGKIVTIKLSNHTSLTTAVDKEGRILHCYENDEVRDKNLADFIGTELAERVLEEGGRSLSGDEVRIGAEGMRSFYDNILVNFMDRYARRWGVRTEDIALDRLDIDGKMHSVKVTPQMKRDVMQGQPMFFRKGNGQVYGFVYDDTVYIDLSVATAETPIHEYAHLWAEVMRRANPAEWRNIVGLLKDAPEVWDRVRRDYPHLITDDQIADEVLAQFSGERGYRRLMEYGWEKGAIENILDKVGEALGRFWRSVADFLHIRYTSKEQVADRVMYDLLSGVNPLGYMAKSTEDTPRERQVILVEKGRGEARGDERVTDVHVVERNGRFFASCKIDGESQMRKPVPGGVMKRLKNPSARFSKLDAAKEIFREELRNGREKRMGRNR